MAAQTYSSKFNLPNNYQDKIDSLDTPLFAIDMNRPATILEKWLPSPFRVLGYGIAPNVGGGLAVTPGSGLSVNVATGFAVVGQNNDAQPIEVLSAASLGGLPASRDSSNPIYLFILGGDGTSGTPVSAYTFQPVFRLDSNSALPGAVILAKITTSATAILTVTDMRQFIGATATTLSRRTIADANATIAMLPADRDLTVISTTNKTITLRPTAEMFATGDTYAFSFRSNGAGAGVKLTLQADAAVIYNLGGEVSTYTVSDAVTIVLSPYTRADGTPGLWIRSTG